MSTHDKSGPKSHNLTPRGGKKGRRTFAGQKMDSPGSAKSGGGAHNWGELGDDYGQEDYAAMDYTPEEIERLRHAEQAEQKAAAREYHRAEEANRLARDEFIRGQKARKAALERHAVGNPFGALYMPEDKGDFGPSLDFAFGVPPADRIRAHMAHPPTEDWSAAIAEDRKIRKAQGLMFQAPPSPLQAPPHPAHAMGPLHAPMPMHAMERALHHEEHVRQMQIAQAAHQYQARHHHDLTMQPNFSYYRGPHERSHGQRFQPQGHGRFGH